MMFQTQLPRRNPLTIRVTIVLDEANNQKLRLIQAKQIKVSDHSVSFSKVLNEVLKGALKN